MKKQLNGFVKMVIKKMMVPFMNLARYRSFWDFFPNVLCFATIKVFPNVLCFATIKVLTNVLCFATIKVLTVVLLFGHSKPWNFVTKHNIHLFFLFLINQILIHFLFMYENLLKYYYSMTIFPYFIFQYILYIRIFLKCQKEEWQMQLERY